MFVAVIYLNMSNERIKYATGWYNQKKITENKWKEKNQEKPYNPNEQ